MRKIAFVNSSIELKILEKRYKNLDDFLILTLDPNIKKRIFLLLKIL